MIYRVSCVSRDSRESYLVNDRFFEKMFPIELVPFQEERPTVINRFIYVEMLSRFQAEFDLFTHNCTFLDTPSHAVFHCLQKMHEVLWSRYFNCTVAKFVFLRSGLGQGRFYPRSTKII